MKTGTVTRVVVMGLMMILGAGCAGQQTQSSEALSESNVVGSPPEGSAFSKVRIGMTSGEVEAIVGKPDSQVKQATAKYFIPIFHWFMPGTESTRFFYKGQGRIIFDNENIHSSVIRVVRVEYDPAEPGYLR